MRFIPGGHVGVQQRTDQARVDVGQAADRSGAAGAHQPWNVPFMADQDRQRRRAFQQCGRIRIVPRAVLHAGDDAGVGGSKPRYDLRPNRHAGQLWKVVKVDPQAIIADLVDQCGVVPKDGLVAQALPEERRQDQAARAAGLNGMADQ